MGQVALAWSQRKVSSPIVGVSSVQRLEEALIGDKAGELSAEEAEWLEEKYKAKDIAAHW